MSDAIACPGCLKRFAWTPKVAAKRVTCHCGQKFITPDKPGGDVIPIYETQPQTPSRNLDAYDLAEPNPDDANDANDASQNQAPRQRQTQHAAAEKCPDCNAPVKPDAVVCVRCGFDLAAGQKLQTQLADTNADDTQDATPNDAPSRFEQADADTPILSKVEQAIAQDEAKRHRLRDWILPAAILALGLALLLFNTLVMAPFNADAALWSFGGGGSWADNVWLATKQHAWLVALIGSLTVVSRVLCASLLGSDFGTPLVALLKIAAFALAFLGLASLAYYGLSILVEGVFFIVIILWISAAFAAFFAIGFTVWDDLDQTEAGLMLAVIGIGFFTLDTLVVPILWNLMGYV